MPSSYTASLRFEQQLTGEGINLWGERLNSALARVDSSIAGLVTKALTGNYSLTSANGSADEARTAILKFTGTGTFTVTIPSVSKRYDVWNACTGPLTITTGSGATAVLQAGEVVAVICDATNVKRVQPTDMGGAKLTNLGTPTSSSDAVTKAYADALVLGSLDIPAGDEGQVFTTVSGEAVWADPVTPDPVVFADSGDVIAGTSSTKAVPPNAISDTMAFRALTDASTIAWDTTSKGPQVKVTLGGNRTMGAPTNMKDGWTYVLDVYQDATGGRTLGFDSMWDFGTAGTPTIVSTATKKTSIVGIYCADRNKLEASVRWRQS